MMIISKITRVMLLLTVSFVFPFEILCQGPDKLTIPAGTKFKTRLETPISSKISEVGDTIIVTLLEPLLIDAQYVLPRGTEMTGKVTFVKRAGKVKGRAEVYALINELTTNYGSEPVQVSIDAADDVANDEKIRTDEEGKLKSNKDLGDDVEDAARGASIGSLGSTPVAIATGNVGAAIAGPAAGAVAGLLLSRGKEVRLPVGSVFRMKFDKDLTLPSSTAQMRSAKRTQK
jgi:type IV secretion system protein VirB10